MFNSLPLDEASINNDRELREWCKNKSAQHFIKNNLTPYNWTSSQWGEGNYLNVKGKWKVNNAVHVINCQVRKGVAEKYANIEITKK